jgi:hypothetical protein
VVLSGQGTGVTVVGGYTPGGASSARIYTLDTATGNEVNLGSLAAGTHDAAAALVARKGTLFGGGTPSTVATVEQFDGPIPTTPATPSGARTSPATGHGKRAASHSTTSTTAAALPGPPDTVITGQVTSSTAAQQLSGSVVGSLPAPRSDASAVTIGRTAYVVGGYDGTRGDPAVLATTDGVHFTSVANLPVAVRYAAVAAYGGRIYLFGGELAIGSQAGQATDTIQVVDPRAKTATVLGHLRQPVAGASAFVLDGHLYVAGGVGPASPASGPSAAGSESGSGLSTSALSSVWGFDPKLHQVLPAGALPVPTSYAGSVVVGSRAWLIGGEDGGRPLANVEMFEPNPKFGMAGSPGAGSPFFGAKLLIADRGNNRLILLDDTDQQIWTYPSTYAAPPPGGFYFPDDAFFAKSGTEIISNQEQNQTIVIIGFPSGKVLWQYGHPGQPGTAPGYLHEPDDAYLLKNGEVTVADADACRILFIEQSGVVAKQIGTNGACVHAPPTDVGTPNGDTPLANGNVLVSEITGSWVTEYTPTGQLVWTVQLPVHYPSDPQQLGSDLYLLSDYAQIGAIDEFNREGQILYRYQPSTGLGRLNQPSLTELLPSGVFMANDDYRDRMVAIDPVTGALVWQYGVADTPGTAPGLLNTPDGFDLLLPNGTTPTHPDTG